MHSNHHFITVIGNIGSGKTTFSKWLAKELKSEFVAADELYKSNPFFKDAVIDRSRWSLASDIWFLIKRVEIVRSLEQTLLNTSIVQDSGIPMSWVYSNSRLQSKHMNEVEMELYEDLFDRFCSTIVQEDLLIYLHFPVPTLLKRIKARGRDFELRHHTAEYLEGLERCLHIYIEKAKKEGKKVVECSLQSWENTPQSKIEKEKIVKEILTHLSVSMSEDSIQK